MEERQNEEKFTISRTITPARAGRSSRPSRRGAATRRTGTSVAVLGVERANGSLPDGERRPANLEDVFVLLTGEEIA